MLCLTGKIRGDDVGVSTLVGDNCNLGGSGKKIDADAPVKDSLRLCDKSVARPNKNIRWVVCEKAECQRRDSLHPTKSQNGISTSQISRIENRRVYTVIASTG